MPRGERKKLKTLIGTYPHTAPLKSGAVRSDRFDLEFTEIVPVWGGFKGMIREDRYDVSEMAVVTYLIARAHEKPLALLPTAMIGRFQHPFAIYNAGKGPLTPADLNGKRVGIRSFTTTTGAWLRGILANDYGVDLDSIEWVTFEDPHMAVSGSAATSALRITTRWLIGTALCLAYQRCASACARFTVSCSRESGWPARRRAPIRCRSASRRTGRAWSLSRTMPTSSN